MKLEEFLNRIPKKAIDKDYYFDNITFIGKIIVTFVGKEPYLSKYNEEHKTTIEFEIDPSVDNEFFSDPINGIDLIRITNFDEVCVRTKNKTYSLI